MTETELLVSPSNITGADFSNLYGLVIGINKYKSPTHHNLEGCVGDAQEIAKYLTDELGVPSDNLVCLFDEEATRENILDKFRTHLIVNAKINTHDPIIIYYAGGYNKPWVRVSFHLFLFFAGHGDRSKAPAEWHTDDGYMETLLPHDAGPSDSQDGYVYGIPDMTLGALLSRLHQEKGDNIVRYFLYNPSKLTYHVVPRRSSWTRVIRGVEREDEAEHGLRMILKPQMLRLL